MSINGTPPPVLAPLPNTRKIEKRKIHLTSKIYRRNIFIFEYDNLFGISNWVASTSNRVFFCGDWRAYLCWSWLILLFNSNVLLLQWKLNFLLRFCVKTFQRPSNAVKRKYLLVTKWLFTSVNGAVPISALIFPCYSYVTNPFWRISEGSVEEHVSSVLSK